MKGRIFCLIIGLVLSLGIEPKPKILKNCPKIYARPSCFDLVCSDTAVSPFSEYIIPSNDDVNFTLPPNDPTKKITFEFKNYWGILPTGSSQLDMWVNGLAGETLKAQISYDFQGDGVYDRVDIFQPLTLDGNIATAERWNPTGANLENTPAPWSNFFNGTIKLDLWIPIASTGEVTVSQFTSITLPFSETKWQAPRTNDSCNFIMPRCNCVAFRLDSVQDYFLTTPAKAILDVFEKDKTPITVGIVGKYFGADSDITSPLRQARLNSQWKVEFATHGFEYLNFTQIPQQQQEDDLVQAKNRMKAILGVEPRVFIPPRSLYNSVTVTALQNQGFTTVSATKSISQETPPFQFEGASFYRFPSAAATASASDYTQGVSALTTYSQISNQIANDGFSVVSLTGFEFSTSTEGDGTVDTNMISELEFLINHIKSNGIEIVTVGNINYDPPINDEIPLSDLNCSCVAFRLDDIQDYYLKKGQKAVLDIFAEYSVPISIGVIANFFGKDKEIVDYVKKIQKACWEVEIVNHGYNHEDFSTFTLEEQKNLLKLSNDKIESILKTRPNVFIPPKNVFNDDTVQALKENQFSHLSSQVDLDLPPYNENPSQNLWRFPIGASTNDLSNSVFFQGISHKETWIKIQQQLERDGFAVVMMHPQEFHVREGGQYGQNLNQTMLEELRSLLDIVTRSGLRPTVIGKIQQYLVLNSSEPYTHLFCEGTTFSPNLFLLGLFILILQILA